MELKFIESTLYAVTYLYKHIQVNYDHLHEDINRLRKELQKVSKVRALFHKGRADIGVFLFDDPSILKNPNMSRACIGLRVDASEDLNEDFIELLEHASGLTSQASFNDTKVLMTKYENKSRLTSTIGRLNIKKELWRLYIKGKYKELWDKGKLVAPIGELYKENEIIYYVSFGEQGKQEMKLTQFKYPS